jgi:hypothetical protein
MRHHWQNNLPLTDNGKINRKALTALAAELDVTGSAGILAGECQELSSTATEQRLAAAWAKVLGLPQEPTGRRAHFFDSARISPGH